MLSEGHPAHMAHMSADLHVDVLDVPLQAHHRLVAEGTRSRVFILQHRRSSE